MEFDRIHGAKTGYLRFISACRRGAIQFSLTPRAEPTEYARCFAVFGWHLLQRHDLLDEVRSDLINALRDSVRSARKRCLEVPRDKPYRQLLSFTLSALAILGALDEDPLEDLVIEQIPHEIDRELAISGALEGRPQSGNQAMFTAIFLLHARDRLGLDVDMMLNRWVETHLASMDRFGFWGNNFGMRHLAFQNGYHQYEILEYLNVPLQSISAAVAAVRSVADIEGHFAPYPGGGGCYDYDAVFMLTPDGIVPDDRVGTLLRRTTESLLDEQTEDGGWGESRYVRPRSVANLRRSAVHVLRALPRLSLFNERMRYAVALQRAKNNCVKTHWSTYSREWGEADLWDSWFRMLAIARIQVAFEPERAETWGFIDYPGIGYHPSLRHAVSTT